MIDLATRAHDHSYHIDPIVRSLLDTDFYKFLMLQFIWQHYRDVPVTFSLINRTSRVRLAEIVSEEQLRAQLEEARTLRFTKSELIWLPLAPAMTITLLLAGAISLKLMTRGLAPSGVMLRPLAPEKQLSSITTTSFTGSLLNESYMPCRG